MVTFYKKEYVSPKKYYKEGHCLSSDSKPTTSDISNGSVLIEIDTGTVYMFNEASKAWVAWE